MNAVTNRPLRTGLERKDDNGGGASGNGITADQVRDTVLDALKKHNTGLTESIKKIDEEVKTYGKASEDATKALAELSKNGVEVETKVAAELKRLGDLEARLAEAEKKIAAGDRSAVQRLASKSVGEQFLESAEFKAYAERFKPTDPQDIKSLRRAKGASDAVLLKSFWEQKDITSLPGSGGAGIWSLRQPEIVSEPYRPLSIRNLIPVIPVQGNLIEYVRTKTRTNNAGMVSEGAAKPKSDLEYERKETAVRKIAHYIKASMEVLADFPRLQALINTELLQMLAVVEEDQILLGDGTGENLLGLIPQATAYDTGLNRANDTRLDVIRHAILQVNESYYPATGIVLHPRDWERIELTKDADGRYIIASATSTTSPRLWGLPAIPSFAMQPGEFLVGSFALAAELYDRMVAQIFLSTEDQDNFIKNMVTVLAEERLGLAVKREQAIVHGSFDDAGLSSGA